MNCIKTEIEDLYIIENFVSEDNRGFFVKTFHNDFFTSNKLCNSFHESYYSISRKDVIRGMHFQLPPSDHEKLVFTPTGRIVDVVVDLRKESGTFGKCFSIELSGSNKLSIYIPKGFAHGFKTLEDNTITVYNVSTVYDKSNDSGIKWDSIDYDWNINNPIISERDSLFISFSDFSNTNPF